MKLFYKIGEFAKLSGVTVKTLRHYESIGLLVPEQVDKWTGYRNYHIGQLQRMESIHRLKAAGLSLDEIGELLENDTQIPTQNLLESKIQQTVAQLQELEERKKRLEAMIDSRNHYQTMEEITLQSLPQIIVASHTATVESYEHIGELCCNVIGPEMMRIGCKCPEPGYCFTIEKEYQEHNPIIEYCEQVTEALEDSAIIKFKTLDAVPTAMCMKVYGPYRKLHQSHLDLFSHIEKNHYRVTGQPRCCYVDGIWNQADPEKWLTIIQVPVEKVAKKLPLNRLKIFCCPKCGNVSFAYGKVSMECCGERIEPVGIRLAEECEKFTSCETDGEYLLQFDCPMTKDNYIAAVIVERHDHISLYRLFPEQEAQVRIPMLAGSKFYTLYRKDGQLVATQQ